MKTFLIVFGTILVVIGGGNSVIYLITYISADYVFTSLCDYSMAIGCILVGIGFLWHDRSSKKSVPPKTDMTSDEKIMSHIHEIYELLELSNNVAYEWEDMSKDVEVLADECEAKGESYSHPLSTAAHHINLAGKDQHHGKDKLLQVKDHVLIIMELVKDKFKKKECQEDE